MGIFSRKAWSARGLAGLARASKARMARLSAAAEMWSGAAATEAQRGWQATKRSKQERCEQG